jgi:hypothetical protein
MEPTTDREIMIKMDGKVDRMCEAVERLADSVEKLETVKFLDHEKRLARLEKKDNEWGGVYRFFVITALAISVVTGLILLANKFMQ